MYCFTGCKDILGEVSLKYFTREWYKNASFRICKFYRVYKRMVGNGYTKFKGRNRGKKIDLLKFLPESIYSIIQNITINSEYPSGELKNVCKSGQQIMKRMAQLDQSYVEYFNSIEKNFRQMSLSYTRHHYTIV